MDNEKKTKAYVTIEDAFLLGTRVFQKKEYAKALKCYTKGIQVSETIYKRELLNEDVKKPKYHSKYITLLDCRSACYLKLNDPTKSLDDSLKMIEIDPYNCKGYLRATKIYIEIKDQQNALEILNKGFNKIKRAKEKYKDRFSVSESLFNKMFEQKQELQKYVKEVKRRKLEANSKTTDPLLFLPAEVLAEIMKNLNQTDILKCLLINHNWNDFIIHSPQLFQHISLTKHIKKPSFNHFIRFINKIKKQRYKYFKSFELICGNNEKYILESFFKDGFITDKLTLALESMNNIQLLSILGKNGLLLFQKLRHLHLQLSMLTDKNNTINTLIKHVSNLQSLALVILSFDIRSQIQSIQDSANIIKHDHLKNLNLTIMPNAEESRFNKPVIQQFIKSNLFPNLKHLKLCRANIETEDFEIFLPPGLETLILEDNPGISLENILNTLMEKRAINDIGGSLKILRITETGTTLEGKYERWQDELSNCGILKNLQELIIRNSRINAKMLDKILKATNGKLQRFHLIMNHDLLFKKSSFGLEPIGGYVNIETLVHGIPSVEELSFIECQDFTNTSLIELSSSMIRFNKPRQLKYLNLSLNKINGVGLVELFNRQGSWLRLNTLVILYCDVNPDSVKYLLKKQYCKKVDYKMSDKMIL